MQPLGFTQDGYGAGGIAEPNVQRADIGQLVGSQGARTSGFLQFGESFFITDAKGADGGFRAGRNRKEAQVALVDEVAAPLGRQRIELLAGVVEAGTNWTGEGQKEKTREE